MFNLIKYHHKLTHHLIPTSLSLSIFSKQKPPSRQTPPSPKQQKIITNNKIREQTQLLEIQKNNFVKQFNEQFSIAKNSSFSFIALLSRSVLISSKQLQLDLVYSQIKKIINANTSQLTPYSCTALIECLNYFKFDGDEQKIIQKLCTFYQNNYVLFTYNQEKQFWKNYITIMTQKMHTSLKFINLTRKPKQIFEFSPLSTIIQKLLTSTAINHKIIKKINTALPDQTLLTINHPNYPNLDILVKFKQIAEIGINQDEGPARSKLQNSIMEQIANLNSLMKNGWNVIIHGKLLSNNISKQQKPAKKSQTAPTPKQTIQLTQHLLNNHQNRLKLLTSAHYCSGFYYTSITITNRQIDIVPTLILSINQKNLSNKLITFIQQNNRSPTENQILDYISLHQLRECLGYAKICQSHWKLFDYYCQIQNFLQSVQQEQVKQKYHLKDISSAIESGQLRKSQATKILSSEVDMMTEMTMKSANSVENLIFEQSYNNQHKKMHTFLGHIGNEQFWQMKPFFDDTLRIMKIIDQIIVQNQSQTKKNVKITIFATKKNIPYLFQNIVQGKYYTVEKSIPNESEKIQKQEIIKELYSKMSSTPP